MADYARRNGSHDEPLVFTDYDGPLHADRIPAEMTSEIVANRPSLVVHFCGHGAQLNGGEVWYLSDGISDWMDRVNVIQFRDMILNHGAGQVCFFSDACQTPAADYADGTPLIRPGNRRRNTFRADLFRATLPGKPAFAAFDGGPLFTSTVLAVLDKDLPPREALSEAHLLKREFVVSSQSLARFVERTLPDEAAGLGKYQYAQMTPGLDLWDNDYVRVDPRDADPDWQTLLKGPEFRLQGAETRSGETVQAAAVPRVTREEIAELVDATSSEWRQTFWEESRGSPKGPFNMACVLSGSCIRGSSTRVRSNVICPAGPGRVARNSNCPGSSGAATSVSM